MVSITITMWSYSNDLDERGLLVVGDHISSSVLLLHVVHYQHPVFERGMSQEKDEPEQYMIIDLQPLFRLLHFCW